MRVYFSWNNWIPPILSGKIYNLSFFPPYVKVPLFGKSLGKEKKKKKKRDRMTLKLTQVERGSTRPATVNQNCKLLRSFALFAIIPLRPEFEEG